MMTQLRIEDVPERWRELSCEVNESLRRNNKWIYIAPNHLQELIEEIARLTAQLEETNKNYENLKRSIDGD